VVPETLCAMAQIRTLLACHTQVAPHLAHVSLAAFLKSCSLRQELLFEGCKGFLLKTASKLQLKI
jgi:hypothetical protein